VCVLYTEIKISTLFEQMMRFIKKLNLTLLLGHPISYNFPTIYMNYILSFWFL